jgi:prevent-host-death family protein
MKRGVITATEFRARCFALLEATMRGQSFRIHKDGLPVAELVPYPPPVSPRKIQRILRTFRKAFAQAAQEEQLRI